MRVIVGHNLYSVCFSYTPIKYAFFTICIGISCRRSSLYIGARQKSHLPPSSAPGISSAHHHLPSQHEHLKFGQTTERQSWEATLLGFKWKRLNVEIYIICAVETEGVIHSETDLFFKLRVLVSRSLRMSIVALTINIHNDIIFLGIS